MSNLSHDTKARTVVENTRAYAKRHLTACAKELEEWDRTSILPKGHIRKMADGLEETTNLAALRVARAIVERLCVERVAKGKPAIKKPQVLETTRFRREGYFTSPPNTGELTKEEARSVARLIRKKQKLASFDKIKGYDICAIDGQTRIGSGRYTYQYYQWPEGYVEHYILKHRVAPSKEFWNFIFK